MLKSIIADVFFLHKNQREQSKIHPHSHRIKFDYIIFLFMLEKQVYLSSVRFPLRRGQKAPNSAQSSVIELVGADCITWHPLSRGFSLCALNVKYYQSGRRFLCVSPTFLHIQFPVTCSWSYLNRLMWLNHQDQLRENASQSPKNNVQVGNQ